MEINLDNSKRRGEALLVVGAGNFWFFDSNLGSTQAELGLPFTERAQMAFIKVAARQGGFLF
jgi:hypothetical protein